MPRIAVPCPRCPIREVGRRVGAAAAAAVVEGAMFRDWRHATAGALLSSFFLSGEGEEGVSRSAATVHTCMIALKVFLFFPYKRGLSVLVPAPRMAACLLSVLLAIVCTDGSIAPSVAGAVGTAGRAGACGDGLPISLAKGGGNTGGCSMEGQTRASTSVLHGGHTRPPIPQGAPLWAGMTGAPSPGARSPSWRRARVVSTPRAAAAAAASCWRGSGWAWGGRWRRPRVAGQSG